MAAQKQRKNCWLNFWLFWMSSNWKPNFSRFTTLDSSRPYGILLENQKHGTPGNYFCQKIFVKLALVYFQKKIVRLRLDFFLHMPFYIWTQYNCVGHLIGLSSRCYKFWRQN